MFSTIVISILMLSVTQVQASELMKIRRFSLSALSPKKLSGDSPLSREKIKFDESLEQVYAMQAQFSPDCCYRKNSVLGYATISRVLRTSPYDEASQSDDDIDIPFPEPGQDSDPAETTARLKVEIFKKTVLRTGAGRRRSTT